MIKEVFLIGALALPAAFSGSQPPKVPAHRVYQDFSIQLLRERDEAEWDRLFHYALYASVHMGWYYEDAADMAQSAIHIMMVQLDRLQPENIAAYMKGVIIHLNARMTAQAVWKRATKDTDTMLDLINHRDNPEVTAAKENVRAIGLKAISASMHKLTAREQSILQMRLRDIPAEAIMEALKLTKKQYDQSAWRANTKMIREAKKYLERAA